jgi:hypothetical protein
LIGVTPKGLAEGAGKVRNTFGSNISFGMDVVAKSGGFDVAMGGGRAIRISMTGQKNYACGCTKG